MNIVVKEVWTASFQSQKEINFVDDDGKEVKIPAVEAHTAACALVELGDGSGVRVVVEFPENYAEKIAAGDSLHIQCKALAGVVDRIFKVKNVLRRIPADKVGK